MSSSHINDRKSIIFTDKTYNSRFFFILFRDFYCFYHRANDINRDMVTQYAQEERLRVRYHIDIESIENCDGNIQVNYANGYHTIYDRVIYALGGTTPVEFLKSCNIELDSNNEPIFTSAHETSVDGLYMVGDIVFNSGGSIAMAINHAHDVLEDITGK